MADLDPITAPSGPGVVLSLEGAIAFVTLNRPDAYNAIDADVTRLLREAIDEIERSTQVRVIVLRGAGKGFCAGGDLPFFAAQGTGLREAVDRMLDDGNHFLQALRSTNKLVVASVHGAAAGAGLSLVMACDFCIAASDAVFVPAYAQLAVSPDMGGTAHMVRAIGVRNAMRVFFLEDRFDALQAERLGIVSRVVDAPSLSEATLALALRLAGLSRTSSEATKALLRQAPLTDLRTQLAAELDAFQTCIHGAETQAALRTFTHKRTGRESPSIPQETPR
ncbi:MAG TPA: enoyl-CoA hydratase/isomerase family protein [Burkholderiaceae bacterium]